VPSGARTRERRRRTRRARAFSYPCITFLGWAMLQIDDPSAWRTIRKSKEYIGRSEGLDNT